MAISDLFKLMQRACEHAIKDRMPPVEGKTHNLPPGTSYPLHVSSVSALSPASASAPTLSNFPTACYRPVEMAEAVA